MQFANDITLTIVADVSNVNPNKHDDLDLYRLEDTDMDAVPDTFVSLGAVCDVVEDPLEVFAATCTVQLNHFSTYAPIVPLDSDSDGVADDFLGERDACPDEDASGFDVDTDGCIDSIAGLTDLVNTLVTEGVISTQMQNSLISKVDNAGSSVDRDRVFTAINELEAFKNQVAVQVGKKISVEVAGEVIIYVDSVISFLESQLSAAETG